MLQKTLDIANMRQSSANTVDPGLHETLIKDMREIVLHSFGAGLHSLSLRSRHCH